jgi:glycosyltransferase involved in cell wall biosynthesis
MPPDAHPADAPDASAGLPSLEDALAESARLHAMRASLLRARAENPVGLPRALRRVIDGRLSHRVRFAALVARRTASSLIQDGPAETFARVRARLRPGAPPTVATSTPPKRQIRVSAAEIEADIAAVKAATVIAERTPDPDERDPAHDIYRLALTTSAGALFHHRVLIVAELSIPQCAKYRVWQKKELFESLGVPCTVVSWWRLQEAISLLQTHTMVILYRVPGWRGPLDLLAEAARIGVPSLWEIDDLIFDVDLYGANANLRDLPRSLRRELLTGASAYRSAMTTADRTIGSTSELAELMTRASGKPSHVVNNALDRETLAFADAAIAARTPSGDRVVIAYGSGTLTHDTDFLACAPALLRLLAENDRVALRIVGTLHLDPAFDRFADRIERLPTTNFKAYLQALASADISLAPLEATTFNDAKSNIKLLEAAIVGLPSVCSPRREFAAAIEHGVDGFLADSDDEWHAALGRLVRDPGLRREVGERARARALHAYAPASVAQTAIAPLAGLIPRTERAPLRILAVNIFFAPRSFGGATVIAEEMAERLAARDDTEIFVVTSHGFPAAQYTLRRYVARGMNVIGVSMPNTHDHILNFDDPEMGAVFADILAAVRPDVVHFHAIQHFGAGIVRACQRARIPYVVTIHDAWWLCQRQFMVRADNTYCYQTTIDLKVCERCLPDTHHLQSRMDILMQSLGRAELVLSPSASHGALYRANGIGADRLVVNRNGVKPPARPRPAREPGPLRFGYVGGNDPLKGLVVIREAFLGLARSDWSLSMVDNTRNLGFTAYKERLWRTHPNIRIVPAYKQDTIDDFFDTIDVLLFPSQWKESFGLTVREALIRDVWVLATDSGGAAEDVVDGVNGTLVPMGNDSAPLRRAVEALLDRSPTFANYVNPYKDRIATLDEQARELRDLLEAASVRDVARTRMAAEQQQQ